MKDRFVRFLKRRLSPLVSKVWENPFTQFTAPEAMARIRAHGFPVATVIDIGASDGRWSRKTMAWFPGARFLAIEPLRERAPALEALKAERPNFDFAIAAAGSGAVQEVRLNVAPDLDGSTVDGHDGEERLVRSATLDELVAERGLTGPFLIKFDTHGFEDEILRGATATLAAASVVIMEVYNFQISPHALRFPAMCARMEGLGFRCYDMADPLLRVHDRCLWQMDFYFCRAEAKPFAHHDYR
jgi:FkbM family methyltransferase